MFHGDVFKGDPWIALLAWSRHGRLLVACRPPLIPCLLSWILLEAAGSTLFTFIHISITPFQADDTPMRTVKTVIHTLVKQQGEAILGCLNRIQDPQASELVPYIRWAEVTWIKIAIFFASILETMLRLVNQQLDYLFPHSGSCWTLVLATMPQQVRPITITARTTMLLPQVKRKRCPGFNLNIFHWPPNTVNNIFKVHQVWSWGVGGYFQEDWTERADKGESLQYFVLFQSQNSTLESYNLNSRLVCKSSSPSSRRTPMLTLSPSLPNRASISGCYFLQFYPSHIKLPIHFHIHEIKVPLLKWNSCARDYIERGLRKIEEEGCAMPISSIGGIGGEQRAWKDLMEHFVRLYSYPGMSGIPPPRTSVLSDNTAVGGSQGSQPQVKISGQDI